MSEPPTDAGPHRIAGRMIGGTLWMVAMRWVIRFIGLINTAILARLLAPADFGVMATGMIAVGLLITLTDGDIEMALVRTPQADASYAHSGWTLKIIAGILTWAVLFAIAPVMAFYYHDDRLTQVIRIAALQPLFMGFENIGVVEFRRKMNFSAEFRYLVTQRLTSFVVGLAIAFSLRNHLALAWSQAASGAITTLLSYRVAPAAVRLSLRHWRELWHFSRWQMLFNSARLIGERSDQLVIGWLAGLTTTGVYAVGFDLALMPTREVILPAGRALLPGYARITESPAHLSDTFHKVLGFGAIVACASGIGVSCVAEDAVLLILGDQWGGAVPFVRWLGLFGALEGIWLMLDPYLIAARQERLLAIANVTFALLTFSVGFASARIAGIDVVPIARCCVMAGVLAGTFLWLGKLGWMSVAALLEVLFRPAAASVAMVTAVRLVHQGPAIGRLGSLMLDIGTGGATYLSVLAALWLLSGRPDGPERDLLSLVPDRLRRL